ncbi:MAG: hypothetical protein AB1345_12700 [Chloroflexota bacterium]
MLERDFFSPNARVHLIDKRIVDEKQALSGVNPAMRLATAILMYSFGGLTRSDAETDEPVAVGVTESELLAAVVGPDLDSLTAQATLGHLRNQCLYLHFDGVHYAFKTTPNVTQVLEDFASRLDVARDIDPAIREELDSRLQGRPAILWPADSQHIPHREPRFILAHLSPEFAFLPLKEQEQRVVEMFTHYGEHLRQYRNGLGLAVPDPKAVSDLREAQKYLLAAQRIHRERTTLNLTTSQLAELNDREKTYRLAQESAIRSLYESVWLPKLEGKDIQVEKVERSGRALAAQGIHERLIELLKISPPHIFDNVTPERMLDLLQLGAGKKARIGISLAEIVDDFYGTLAFPRLESSAAIRKAVAEGVQRGLFGYIGRAGLVDTVQLREGSGYLIAPELVRIGIALPEIEIDEGSSLIVLPQIVRQDVTEEAHAVTAGEAAPAGEAPSMPETIETPDYTARRTHLLLSMQMTRQQLFAAWNAFKNLADLVGHIRLTIEAHKPDGFDENWLRNAVREPLDEADVEVEEE